MVSTGENFIGSQFFFTLGADLTSLDGIHCVIGEVAEGHEVLRKLNEAIVDNKHRPYKDIRITHTVILEDPYADPRGFREPSRSPSPSAERLRNSRIAADEDIDDTQGKTEAEIQEMLQDREAKARATILEIVGDIPDAEVAPPENVLFVCKLNPVTTDDDLQIIFSRFGKIKTCEVIRDKVTGDSLQYAFIEFEEQKFCEDAYFKMDNVLIDDRRIHVDFSQSVSKIKWRGKGNYTIHDDSDGFKSDKTRGRGNRVFFDSRRRSQSRSPRRDRDRFEKPRSRGFIDSRRKSRSKSPRRDRDRNESARNRVPNDSRRRSKSPRRDHKRHEKTSSRLSNDSRRRSQSRSPKRDRDRLEKPRSQVLADSRKKSRSKSPRGDRDRNESSRCRVPNDSRRSKSPRDHKRHEKTSSRVSNDSRRRSKSRSPRRDRNRNESTRNRASNGSRP